MMPMNMSLYKKQHPNGPFPRETLEKYGNQIGHSLS